MSRVEREFIFETIKYQGDRENGLLTVVLDVEVDDTLMTKLNQLLRQHHLDDSDVDAVGSFLFDRLAMRQLYQAHKDGQAKAYSVAQEVE